MRILITTYRYPSHVHSADRHTVYRLIKHLSKNHKVYIAAPVKDKAEAEMTDLLEPYCEKIYTPIRTKVSSFMSTCKKIFSSDPLQMGYFSCPELRKMIPKIVKENSIDILYGYHLRSSQNMLDVQDIPKIIALQPAQILHFSRRVERIKNPFMRAIYGEEHRRLIGFERKVAEYFDKALLISETDRHAIDPEKTLNNVMFSPHGTDVDYFTPPKDDFKKDPATLIFTGALSIDTNSSAVHYFYEKIFPIVKKEIPEIKFLIVGSKPPGSVQRLADDPAVTVTGFVEEMLPYLHQATVGLDPLLIGAGLQNKMLEGMAAGLPMVVTPVANEGIGAEHGKEVLVAKDEKSFAQEVVELINNPERQREIGENAREYICRKWTWEYYFSELEEVMETLITDKNQ